MPSTSLNDLTGAVTTAGVTAAISFGIAFGALNTMVGIEALVGLGVVFSASPLIGVLAVGLGIALLGLAVGGIIG